MENFDLESFEEFSWDRLRMPFWLQGVVCVTTALMCAFATTLLIGTPPEVQKISMGISGILSVVSVLYFYRKTNSLGRLKLEYKRIVVSMCLITGVLIPLVVHAWTPIMFVGMGGGILLLACNWWFFARDQKDQKSQAVRAYTDQLTKLRAEHEELSVIHNSLTQEVETMRRNKEREGRNLALKYEHDMIALHRLMEARYRLIASKAQVRSNLIQASREDIEAAIRFINTVPRHDLPVIELAVCRKLGVAPERV